MNRSNYSCELNNWDLIRWRGAVKSAIRGKRGQKLLSEMAATLDAMPEKKLIAGELVSDNGECCALGAVAISRGLDVKGVDPEDSENVAELFDISDALAREIVYINDESITSDPSERWRIVRDWVESQIRVSK